MRDLCEDIQTNAEEIVAGWERLVCEEPWFSLPREHRADNLSGVVAGLAGAALCDPTDAAEYRFLIEQGVRHGSNRRAQGIPESMIFIEYHLLRQALWYYLVARHGASDRVVRAIMRIDSAITATTNATMWGYYRPEVEAMDRWNESLERLAATPPRWKDSSPLFRGE